MPRLHLVQTVPGSCRWIPGTSPPTCGWDLGSSPPLYKQSAWTSPPPFGPSLSSCPPGFGVDIFSPVGETQRRSAPGKPFGIIQSQMQPLKMSDFDESNVQLLRRVASLQVASYIDVIVSDDAGDDVRCGDALRPRGGHEHAWHVNTR